MRSELFSFEHQRSLKELCTLGIGGPARDYIEVNTIETLQSLIKHCKEEGLRYFILGKGSNTLFDDRGFDGVVIHNKISFFNETSPGVFHVGAGYSFSRLGAQTARQGWSGLEFASGIPGSVGGAVFMNAGANGTETCKYLSSINYIDENGVLHTYSIEELQFSYRYSSFHEKKGAIVGATFTLIPSDKAREKQLKIIHYRTETQPYGEKSAGCIFRNPPDHPAGKLIETCKLKGEKQGDAQVSLLHGNFLINTGSATSKDVLALVKKLQVEIKKQHGIELESEVRYIPFQDETIPR